MTQTTPSIPAQRQRLITEYLKENHSITIKQAADLCQVSEATARRDIDELSGTGDIERTHGGAVIHKGTGFEAFHSEKMKVMIPEKTGIAMEAVKLIKEGDSIFLDSGTTTFLLAQLLKDIKRLTVITNNLDIAYTARLHTSSSMIVTGGLRRDGYSVLVGDIAEEFIRKLYVDISFVGADAINVESGIFNSDFMEVGIKKSMIASGKKAVLLADHSKFDQKALAKVCDIGDLDFLITDPGLNGKTEEYVRTKVSNLLIAK